MDTLGITNGCVDLLISAPSYVAYAHNNTYDLQLFSDEMYKDANYNFTKPGGCRDLILQCRLLGEQGDPSWSGNNKTVNEACQLATQFCYAYVVGDLSSIANVRIRLPSSSFISPFRRALHNENGKSTNASSIQRSNFYIAVTIPDPCPLYLPVPTYLNQPWVQSALGVPLNYTSISNVILADYSLDFTNSNPRLGTGDGSRRSITELEYALAQDIKVAMVYGDRDYRCNWLGGEATALTAKYSHSNKFRESGYERIRTNGTYEGM